MEDRTGGKLNILLNAREINLINNYKISDKALKIFNKERSKYNLSPITHEESILFYNDPMLIEIIKKLGLSADSKYCSFNIINNRMYILIKNGPIYYITL